MQLLLTTKRHFTIALWMCQSIRSFPSNFELILWYMMGPALNLISSTYYNYTLSATTRTLNVPRTHVDMENFLLRYVELVPKICPHLSVAVCITDFHTL
jgi:hypothetical protein